MIFNTLIKGKGVTGKPIEVTELPIPTEKDIGKIYLLKTEEKQYIYPEVGQVIGDKIYFDTSVNPLNYVANEDEVVFELDKDGSAFYLSFIDVLPLVGVEGYGSAYVLGVADGDLNLVGLSYIYCDTLTVDQFNSMIGANFGVSISEFGWQTDVIDISSIASPTIVRSNLANFGYIAYIGEETKVSEEYYTVAMDSTLQMGEPLPRQIHYDLSVTPNITVSEHLYLTDEKQTRIIGGQHFTDEETGGNGDITAIFAMWTDEERIELLYIDGSASVEVINAMIAEIGFPLTVTKKGWQGDGVLDTSFGSHPQFIPEMPVGNKIYFDTSVNPLDLDTSMSTSILRVDVTEDDYYQLVLMDLFAVQNVTGMGHCYVVALGKPDMSVILGVPYIYCDALTVEQFNTNVGADFGIQITEFGWQYDEIDTSSIANLLVRWSNVSAFSNIVYGDAESMGLYDLPLDVYNDPQNIFSKTPEMKFEKLGDEGRPIEVSVLPEATEENKGKIYLLTPTDEYYECTNAPFEVGQPLGTVIGYDTSKVPTLTEGEQLNYLIASDELLLIAGMYSPSEQNNGEGDIKMIVAMFVYNPKVLYVDGSASIETINNWLSTNNIGTITQKGWQGNGQLNLIDWLVEVGGGNQTAEELKQAEELLNTTFLIEEVNDTEGLFSKGPGMVLINEAGIRKDFEEQIESQEAQINTLTSEKANLSEQLSNMINRVATRSYKFNTERGAIYPYEFTGWDGYDAVVVPNGMFLREYAFYKSNIDEVGLHSGITDIPGHCFEGSNTYVNLPSNVTTIGERAFFGNTKISAINIPATLTTIGEAAFGNMPYLSTIEVDSGNVKYEVVDGALCVKQGQYIDVGNYVVGGVVVQYPPNSIATDFVSNKGAITYAFSGCNKLKKITVGQVYMGQHVFDGCNSLESLSVASIPSLGMIGEAHYDVSTFADLFGGSVPSSLTSINAGSYENIPDFFFAGLTEVKNITLVPIVSYSHDGNVGAYAFFNCTSVQSLDLSAESLTHIGAFACQSCVALKSVQLGSRIREIGYGAFSVCAKLSDIALPLGLLRVEENAFCRSGLTSLTIPDSVQYIGSHAAAYAPLTDVTIGSGVAEIGYWAFGGNPNLKSVVVKAIVPPIAKNGGPFNEDIDDLSIYVPVTSIDAYKTEQYWNTYASQMYPYVETTAELSSIDTTAYTKANVNGVVYNYDGSAWIVEE